METCMVLLTPNSKKVNTMSTTCTIHHFSDIHKFNLEVTFIFRSPDMKHILASQSFHRELYCEQLRGTRNNRLTKTPKEQKQQQQKPPKPTIISEIYQPVKSAVLQLRDLNCHSI